MTKYLKLLGIHPTSCFYPDQTNFLDGPIDANHPTAKFLQKLKFPLEVEITHIKKDQNDCPLVKIKNDTFCASHFVIEDTEQHKMWLDGVLNAYKS